MGLFDFLRGRRPQVPAAADGAAMRPENPSWILVEGSDPDAIQHAVTEHSGLTRPEQPARHRVTIVKLDPGRFGVTFEPPAPPYAFTNLVGWLDDPQMNRGARRAVGWLVAPADGVRYFLGPDRGNASGDTLLGVGADGRRVSVFLPDCSVTTGAARAVADPEPELLAAGAAPVATFEVTLDADPAFGNPRFDVG